MKVVASESAKKSYATSGGNNPRVVVRKEAGTAAGAAGVQIDVEAVHPAVHLVGSVLPSSWHGPVAQVIVSHSILPAPGSGDAVWKDFPAPPQRRGQPFQVFTALAFPL